MTRYRSSVTGLLAAFALFGTQAHAASLQPVSNWGASGVPSYISMYIYVPDKLATNPPILVVSHYCGGSASGVFGQAQTGGIVSAADKYGFIMIFPQTTNSASSAKCWDVGSTKSLTHDGGGDTQAVAQMVKYTITTYKANADRVYATGDSSGGMMTEALLAVYPDIFKAGSSFAGVPAGCWSLGWSAASNWGSTCAGSGTPAVSSVNETAQQWGDKVRAMDEGYSGHRPRVQLFHGDKDQYIAYTNLREGIKEWTNVLGLSTDPTSTDTGLTLGSHQATRQRWTNSCGYVVLEAITSLGGDHGPSDALFNSSYVLPFLGLDKTDAVDPEVAQCSAGGAPSTGGATSTGGTTATTSKAAGGTASFGGSQGIGGTKATGGVAPGTGGGLGTGGTKATSTSGVAVTGGSANAGGSKASGGSSTADSKAAGGTQNTGGGQTSVAGNSATGGVPNTGVSSANGGASGTITSATSGTAIGGESTAFTSSTEAGQVGGAGTSPGSPSDAGSCGCRAVGTANGQRSTMGALLLAACVAALRLRRRLDLPS